MKRAFLLLIFLGLATHAKAADFYFAQNSAGANNGTNPANAYSAARFNTNDSNWTGGNNLHLSGAFTSPLTVQASGTAGNVITIIFETGGTLASPTCSAVTGCLNLNGKSFITVDGGTNGSIQNTADGAGLANHLATALLITGSGANNVIIKNLSLINAYIHILNSNDPGPGGYYGILARHNSNLTIGPNNTFTNADVGILFEWDGGESNLVVQGNTFSSINQDIEMGPTAINAAMTNVKVFNNTASAWALWDEPSNSYHHNFFHPFTNVSGASLTGTLQIYNNFSQGDMGNHATSMIFLENNAGGTGGTMASWYVFNNVLDKTNSTAPTSTGIMVGLGTTNGGFFLNNTVRDAGGSGANAWNSFNMYVDGWTIKNNIFQGGAYMIYDQASAITAANNNIYFNSPSGTPWIWGSTFISSITTWRSTCSCDSVSITTDPKLNSNLTLQVGSSAIGEGQNLTSLGITPLNSDAAGVARPGGSTVWDAGALSAGLSPSITTASPLPNGFQNIAYSTTISGVGGTLPYAWSVISGSLPTGLSINSSTGVISGTPTVLATSSFTVQLADANSLTNSRVFSLTINSTAPATFGAPTGRLP